MAGPAPGRRAAAQSPRRASKLARSSRLSQYVVHRCYALTGSTYNLDLLLSCFVIELSRINVVSLTAWRKYMPMIVLFWLRDRE